MADNNGIEPATDGEFIVYTSDDGATEIHLRAVDGTVWLSQRDIARLFDKSVPTINEHIKNIFDDEECDPEATIRKSRIVQEEGGRLVGRLVDTYNLDVILAVGYRVRSDRGTKFRQYATTVLKDYLVKGFAMNDAKLKDPAGLDYFDELLERIRDIRASEKRFYQKVRDLFKETSSDYDRESPAAQTFFSTIQNKLVYAVTGRTAAELVCDRSDPAKPNMGLTTWKGPKVRKCDIEVSKNYLTKDEVDALNRLTTMFLDYAEDRAKRRETMTMADWIEVTDKFLDFNDRSVLRNAGSVSSAHMKSVVGGRYNEFDKARKAAELKSSEAEHVEELENLAREVGKR
ncbi:virulence RhuM family protein [Gordonia sp. WA4-43]|uniref:virulence RhuM family protein n=1 Tax=Gordonia sp. WA4-43 TaxID=2878678 RepID=UPI001CFAD00C|nr:virulence RhuM family protein [Gordonia sp. WA4-43]UCZ88637.1 virulence RhuM family protein [Gordonia sp. WA4-43]